MQDLKNIPTNIITGFLGVGKSTAIVHLLTQKPPDERWAVLVNEFGEVGIDGGMFTGNHEEGSGFFIREVPGGCMCCAAGIPMQVALNMLLARARPHRLLIEPTGLGHPVEMLQSLSSEHYRDVLNIQATITLIDARKIHDSRYTLNKTFNQQLHVADIIVANKADQYQETDFPSLLDYLDAPEFHSRKQVYQVSHGKLQLDWLNEPSVQRYQPYEASKVSAAWNIASEEIPRDGFLSLNNDADGFYSRGWIFHPDRIFDVRKLRQIVFGLDIERVKGVFITQQGIYFFNKADSVLSESLLNEADDSRIECIGTDPQAFSDLDKQLLTCLTDE